MRCTVAHNTGDTMCCRYEKARMMLPVVDQLKMKKKKKRRLSIESLGLIGKEMGVKELKLSLIYTWLRERFQQEFSFWTWVYLTPLAIALVASSRREKSIYAKTDVPVPSIILSICSF